jgi:hypothetical protein
MSVMSVVPMEGTAVPAWVKDMGGTSSFNPLPFESCRFFLTGPPKQGKTTLMCSMERTAYLDFEGGAHSVPHKKATVFYVPVFSDGELTPIQKSGIPGQQPGTWLRQPAVSLTSIIKKLKEDAGSSAPYFQHVVFDSVDRLQEMCLRHLETNVWKNRQGLPVKIGDYLGGKGGWSELAVFCMSHFRGLNAMGLGWTAIAHLKTESIPIPGTTNQVTKEIRPAITPSFYGALGQDAEYLLHISKESGPKDPKTGLRKSNFVVHTEATMAHKEDYPQGGRVTLPPKLEAIPLDGGCASMKVAYDAACQKLRG